MGLPIAERWFERTPIDDEITLLWEPHVVPLMRCNIWHVRGTTRDLIVDTEMRVTRLIDEHDVVDIGDYCATMERLMDIPVTVVHAGHDPSFGRDRLREIASDYLARRS